MGNCTPKYQNKRKKSCILPIIHKHSLSDITNQIVLREDFSYQKKKKIDARISKERITQIPKSCDRAKTQSDVKLIQSSLERHFIFTSLTEIQKTLLINEMELCMYSSNEVIFQQSSSGKEFFVVSTGRLDVIINSSKKAVLKEGDSFGELALLHDTPRTATVQAITSVSLWVLDRYSFKKIINELSTQNYKENKDFISSVPLFSILSDEQKETLINCLTVFKFNTGEHIVKEGDPGDLFFVIKAGTVSCISKGLEIRKMTNGEFFGEQALLYNCTRTATIVATEPVVCLALNRKDLKIAMGESFEKIIYKGSFKIAIYKNPQLQKLDKKQAENVMNSMQLFSFGAGQKIVEKGEEKHKGFFVVLNGRVAEDQGSSIFEVFDVIGIEDVIKKNKSLFEVGLKAKEKAVLAYVSRKDFTKAIGGRFESIVQINEILSIIKKVQIFKDLNRGHLENIAKVMKCQEFSDGEMIVQQNTLGDSFYVIKSGKVEILKDGHSIRTHTQYDYFGERSLLFDDVRSASAVSIKKSICYVVQKNDFINMLNTNIKKMLLERIELQDESISLTDLAIIKQIGTGMFGNVFLSVHKTKKKIFALKTVDRRKIALYQLEENIALERKVLLTLDHFLIARLVKTFKDEKRLYFLMEYIQGLDLFDLIRELGILKEEHARFYIGCIFEMLSHLHERKIMHRDLKPENIVIDKEGYPKLIDFGTAKFVNGRTYTIVGTPHYMAPEIVTSKGYALSAEYWAVGVVLYELVVGSVPFGENENDPYVIYELVQNHRLVFPSWLDNKNKIKEFISKLLDLNPANRFNSLDLVKGCQWFTGFDWEKMMNKEINPPFKPKVGNLDEAAEGAIRLGKSVEEVVLKIEKKEEIGKQRRRSAPPVGWDEEF